MAILEESVRPPAPLTLTPEQVLKEAQRINLQTLTPLEFLDHLAALIPPPRKHRHRDHGVLAPNSALHVTGAEGSG